MCISICRNKHINTCRWLALPVHTLPPSLPSGISWAAYFAFYERIKTWHLEAQGVERLGPTGNMMAAAQAGAMVGPWGGD